MGIDDEQVTGSALELGGVGQGDDGDPLLGREADPVENRTGEMPQQAREAVCERSRH